MGKIEVTIETEDFLDEVEAADLIGELKFRAERNKLDRWEIDQIKKLTSMAGAGGTMEDSLKEEEWNEVKNQKTSMQWREFFQNMGKAVTA